MSKFEPAEILRDHRPLLLALEAIGWLHMAGKAKADFLRGQGGQSNNYKYERWFKDESPPFPWSDLLDWVKSQYPLHNNAWPSTLTDFVTKHTKRDPGLLGLLQAGHAMASGIEKNLPTTASSNYLKQDATHTWLSSSFGHPVRNLLSHPPMVLTDAGWAELVEEILQILDDLRNLGESSTQDIERWWSWREKAIGQNSLLRQAFTSTVAETRLPNNDVTLWDQSYVATALFKSAVAGAVLEGQKFQWNNAKQNTRWRLLTIGIGTDHYESRAVKIGDWKGAQQAIDEFFSKVRRLVEVDLACGSLLYRDTEVAIFSFPGEQEGANTDLSIKAWENYLLEQEDEIARKLGLETPPYCKISEPSRSLILLTHESQKARQTLEAPVHRNWEILSGEGTAGHVCPVCFVRLNEEYSDKQKPCSVCYDRRLGRLKDWLGENLKNDTIWIDEIVDSNDRAALLTFSLNIEPWLDGTRIDSFRAQSIQEWRRHNPVLKNNDNPIDLYDPYHSLLGYVRGKLDQFEKNDSVLSSLQEGYRYESDWPTFFRKIVEDRADAPSWDELDKLQRMSWLVHQLFRKLASPGRVYRFWRQTEAFFRDQLHEFRGICSRDPNRWRVCRLILKPDPSTSSGWKDHEIYSVRWRDAPLELLYRQGEFLTTCNLARLLGPEETKDALKGEDLKLRDDKGRERSLKIKDVTDDVGTLGIYHPIIPLELSPLRFRVLVPLKAVSECVNRTIEAWEEEFGHVWDRLPLRVGIVAFPRMMPFQAIIEAARNLENDLGERCEGSETWRVAESAVRDGVAALRLIREDGEQEIKLVPVRLPDGREDVFYPYQAVEDSSIRFARDFRHPDGQVYRHVMDLKVGDGVKVFPSKVAALFLENTATRFDPLEIHYLTEWKAMQDVWDLIQRIAPSQTALRGFWGELEACRVAWHNPDGSWSDGGEQAWLELARATLSNQLMAHSASLDALTDASRTGLLRWALEWHLRVLKESVGGKL
ncbi:MAG: CRISPR-associated protein Csx11 [Methanothrix sp.]